LQEDDRRHLRRVRRRGGGGVHGNRRLHDAAQVKTLSFLTNRLLLQGFNQEDLEADKKETKEKQQVQEESDSDEGVDRSGQE